MKDKEILLNEDERLDEIKDGYFIVQNKNLYCFNSDSVFLANYIESKKTDKVLEIGAGTGIISMILAIKKNIERIDAIEIQTEYYELLKKSIKLNSLEKKINSINIDFNEYNDNYSSYDIIVTNPPYFKVGKGFISKNDKIDIARHEIKINLEDIVSKSKKLLRCRGKFYIVLKTNRIQELMYLLEKYNFSTKKILFLKPNKNKKADTFILEAIKDGNTESKIDYLEIYDLDGKYTKEALKYYE